VRLACLATAGLVVFSLFVFVALAAALVLRTRSAPAISLASPVFNLAARDTPTPYPTRPPYRTELPYKTATSYPTQAAYATTGLIGTPRRYTFYTLGGCSLVIKNRNFDLDAVIVLTHPQTLDVIRAFFVRARDSLSYAMQDFGGVEVYAVTGQDWDETAGRFQRNAFYFRFEEKAVFNDCGYHPGGGHHGVEIILNVATGPGVSLPVAVPPESFPSLAP
jgi:hypothetical protein